MATETRQDPSSHLDLETVLDWLAVGLILASGVLFAGGALFGLFVLTPLPGAVVVANWLLWASVQALMATGFVTFIIALRSASASIFKR